MTGLTEQMRARFGREIAQETKPHPDQRLNKTTDLIRNINKSEKTKDWTRTWDVSFQEEPLKIEGKRFAPGGMLIGEKRKLDFESQSIDRDSQCQMLEQPVISEILVFYPDSVNMEANDFMKCFKDSKDTYNYPFKARPEEVAIRGRGWDSWNSALMNRLKPSVTCAVFILRGAKGKGEFYNEIKRLVITKAPVPTQVVLSTTISRGKNKRSIVNKVLVQICAKIGGTPWGIEKLPYSEKPTMCIGIDEYKNPVTPNSVIIGFCATNNIFFTRYFNTALFKGKDESTEENRGKLRTVMEQAISNFAFKNGGRLPDRIVCFRNGVAEHQREIIKTGEMNAMINGIKNKLSTDSKKEITLIYVAVNKSLGTKFFLTEQNRLVNPKPGTLVDSQLCNPNEFYLISQNTRVGSPCPTHYTVLYNNPVSSETQISPERSDGSRHSSPPKDEMTPGEKTELAMFAFKLAYLYFNTLGPVKVPAPVHYAARLCTMLANISSRDTGNIVPHSKAENLYFI